MFKQQLESKFFWHYVRFLIPNLAVFLYYMYFNFWIQKCCLLFCVFSTFVDPVMRKKMGDQAVQLARAVGYDSAGMDNVGATNVFTSYICL